MNLDPVYTTGLIVKVCLFRFIHKQQTEMHTHEKVCVTTLEIHALLNLIYVQNLKLGLPC